MSKERKGHYVKPATRVSVPAVVFAVHPIPQFYTREQGEDYQTGRWYMASAAVSYKRRAGWTAPQSTVVTTPDALREWLAERALPGRTNWAIAPSLGDFLALSEWFSYAQSIGCSIDHRRRGERRARPDAEDRNGLRISALSLTHRFELLEYVERGTRWRWVGSRNYWPDGEVSGGLDEGQQRVGMGRGRIGDQHRGLYGATDGRALCLRLTALCGWWERTATAPFGRSAGQLAWGILRSHIAPRSLCTHSDDYAHGLERSAAHGGRATVWYAGPIERPGKGRCIRTGGTVCRDASAEMGPVTRVDVRSMYPALLARERFPVKLKSVRADVPVDEAIGLSREWGVIARVRIETERAEYPYRSGERVLFPVGTFTTTLTGPEIVDVARTGKVLKVFSLALYALGRPFVGGVRALLAARSTNPIPEEAGGAALAKLLAVSLAGRLAIRMGGWVRSERDDEPGRWGEIPRISAKTGQVTRIRYLMGCASRWEEDRLPKGPHTAAFAYLTAYGRLQMAAFRALCPAYSVVAQHTDGLSVLPAGLRALRAVGTLDGTDAGTLRQEDSADSAQFFGPRHYRFGNVWTLAGLSDPTPPDDKLRVTYLSRTPLFNAKPIGPPDRVITVRRRCTIKTDLGGGYVGKDGWVYPPRRFLRPGSDDEDANP